MTFFLAALPWVAGYVVTVACLCALFSAAKETR